MVTTVTTRWKPRNKIYNRLNIFFTLVGTPCFVTGWGVSDFLWVSKAIAKGRKNKVKVYQDKLQVLAFGIVNRRECEKAFMNTVRKMGPDHICAGSNVLRKSPCIVSRI